MADDAAELVVNVSAKESVTAVLQRLEASLEKSDATATRLATALESRLGGAQQRVAQTTAQSEREALRYATALAAGQRATGDLAGSVETLRTALGQMTPNTIEANQATVRLASAEKELAASLQPGPSLAQQFGASFKASLLSILGPAALVTAAIGALSAVFQEAKAGFELQASLDASRKSIELLLNGVRDSGAVFAGAARFANTYKLTQQETTEAIQASIRIIRTSKAPIEDILGAFARLKVLAPEKTFQDASRALSELQAGQVVSIEHLFNVPRRDANEMKRQIEGGADAVKVLNDYLDKTGVTMDAVKAQAEGAAGKIREAAQASERLALAFGGGSGGPGLALLNEKIAIQIGLSRILEGNYQEMGASIRQAGEQGTASFQGLITAAGPLGPIISQITSAASAHAAAAAEEAAATAQVAAATQQLTGAQLLAAQLTAQATGETEHQTQASQHSAEAQVLEAVQSDILSQRKAVLAQQAQNAANALLLAGDAGRAAAAKLANSSSLVDQLTAAFYRLAAAKAAASANPQGGTPEQGGDALTRSLNNAGASQAFLAQQTARATKAQQDQILATGTHAQKIQILEAEYERLSRIYGKNSAEAIAAQTKILQETDKATGAAKKGGAARLSDQAKLNNQLLANQGKYDDQAEDAEKQHEKKLLDIEAEFQRKSLEQQRQNEVAKRQSRADFYDSLTSATKDIGPKEAQALSAAYEQAYARAQEIAQSGQQKLAADYLAFKQREIQAEVEFQKQLAEARKNGDKSEVARLEAIHNLRQQANAEEEKQLLAGGDANVNAKNEALNEENARAAEQADKLATSADRAADRLVVGAERAGKAVSDKLIPPLQAAGAALDKIAGPAGGGPAAAPGATGGGAAAPATPTDLAAALDSVRAAVAAVEAAVTSAAGSITAAQRDTTGAVRGLSGRLIT